MRHRMIGMQLLLGALALGAPVAVQAQGRNTNDHGTGGRDSEVVATPVGRTLDDYLTRATAAGFSGVVLVASHGKVVLHRAYGWADATHRVPNTIKTGFPISSNTKMFTATMVTILVSRRQLRFTDSISKYLPDVPADKRGITIHQLLTHSSGLGDGYAAESNGILEGVQKILHSPLAHPIGTQWDYSNAGYHLLEAILEQAGGEPIDTLRRRLLFAPAKMQSTGTLASGVHWAAIAHGQNLLTDGGARTQSGPNARVGRVGLISTAADLWRWEQAWRSGPVLNADMKAMLSRPYVDVQPKVKQTYGMFVMTTDYGQVLRMGGNDTPEGFTSEFRRLLDIDGFIVVLNNTMWDATPFVRKVRNGIEAILSGEAAPTLPATHTISAARQVALAGDYRDGSTGRLIVWSQGKTLLAGAEGQSAINALFPADSGAELTRRADYTMRTADMMQAAVARQHTPLLDSALERMCGSIGKVATWDTLGTAPTPPDDDATATSYVRIHCQGAASEGTIRLVWSDADLAMVLPGTPRPFLPVIQDASGQMVAFNLLTKATPIRFGPLASNGKPQRLAVGPLSSETVFQIIE